MLKKGVKRWPKGGQKLANKVANLANGKW